MVRCTSLSRLVLFLLMLLVCVCMQAQVCTSRVVDSETGEPLPYASVYVVGRGGGTIANSEGVFTLAAATDDTLRLSFVGYEPLQVSVSQVGNEVRLAPVSTLMDEVTVLPMESILQRIYDKLTNDYKIHRKETSDFFLRQNYEIAGTREMVEGFLQCRSAVNLRDIRFSSGRHFRASNGPSDKASMVFTNLHFPLSLAPMVRDERFWINLVTPFSRKSRTAKSSSNYVFSVGTLKQENGKEVMRIDFRGDGLRESDTCFLEGRMYVESGTYRLLAFEGDVVNMLMDLTIGASPQMTGKPVTLHVRVGYDSDSHYARVRDVVTELVCMGTRCQSVMLNLDGFNGNLPKQKARGNMLEAISHTKYDPDLWSDEIIKRSEAEEQIVQQKRSEDEAKQVGMLVTDARFPVVQGEMDDDSLRFLVSQVASYAKKTPQEIVSVHMDNTSYFLGDTIWYRAYVLREGKMCPSDISGVLYAELLNQDGYLVERQTLRLRDGMASGSFCLCDTAYAGYYELRAYTRWQLNWGEHEHAHHQATDRWFLRKDMPREFYRDYDKLYSRVFPVYDKPQEAGNYSPVMTLRPLRRYYKLKQENPTAVVTLYPEGGNWVDGATQRIAFEAVNELGEYREGQLVIRDGYGNVVAKASTEHRGRGVLTLKSLVGEKYRAEFLWGDGQCTKVELPKRESQGVNLRTSEEDRGLVVKVECVGLCDMPLGLTVMQNGAVRYQSMVCEEEIVVPQECLDAGVAQVTVFDRSGRVWADRLLFCCMNRVREDTVCVDGLPAMLTKYDKMTLEVKGPAHSHVSLAVRDRARSVQTYDSGNLLTEALLCSQIKGFVESPEYYFEADDSVHRYHLDLLLMVQGWRRHVWKDMTQPFVLKEPFEQSPILRGDVYNYTARAPEDLYYTISEQDVEHYRNLYPTGGTCGPKIEEMRKLVEVKVNNADVALTESVTNLAELTTEVVKQEAGVGDNSQATVSESSITNMQKNLEIARNAGFYSTEIEDKFGSTENAQYLTKLKNEVTVHAQFSVLASQTANRYAEVSAETHQGQFVLQAPHSDTPYYLHLIAVKDGNSADMVSNADEYPDYSVRIRWPYPRFVKPYQYYQTHLPAYADLSLDMLLDDSTTMMPSVSVGARHGGLRALDLSKPAMVVDAYDAYNQVVDAGLMPAWLCGSLFFSLSMGRLYVGDMGIMRSYDLLRRWSGRTATFFTSISEQLRHNHLNNLDKVLIYTDYAPRLEGDSRYQGADQPSVTVNMLAYPRGTERPTSRDRMYVMSGYDVCEDFYHPHYEHRPLPDHTDYRRTLYWNPDLLLDDNGRATVTLWGGSCDCEPEVSLDGLSGTGEILMYVR